MGKDRLGGPFGDAVLVCFEEIVGGVVDGDGLDGVSALDGIDDVLAAGDFTEDGVFAVEVGSGEVGDEELGAVGVRSGVGHGEDAGFVVLAVGFAFALELVAGVTGAGAEGAAALDHEIGDDAVEGEAVVVSAAGEAEEGGAGDGGVLGEHGDVDISFGGFEGDVHGRRSVGGNGGGVKA